tara:strand:- start:1566 stop:1952 length:387 start_codon:yes stop_codon:yes gene_type:complete
MEAAIKKHKRVCTSFMSNAIIMLENIEDLKNTPIWSRELKFYGNKFLEELEKKTLPVEKAMHRNEKEVKLVQEIQTLYEEIFKDMAEINIEQLIDLKYFVKDLISGNVIKVTKEQAKKIKEKKLKQTK